MKFLISILAGVLMGLGGLIPFALYTPTFSGEPQIFGGQVSVPTASTAGWMLVSSSSGAYQATTTWPLIAGSFYATSTRASVLPYASTTGITSSYASTSLFFANGLGGCSVGQYLTWSNGSFSCATDQNSGGSSGIATTSLSANDFDASASTISIDYTNGQAASVSNKGFLTAADWATFNSKLSSYDAFSRLTTFATTTAATNTPIWTQGVFFSSSTKAASQFPYASSTAITAVTASSTNLYVSGAPGALALIGTDGLLGKYGGAAACTNQVVTAISAVGATTCASVTNAMLSNSSITINTTGIATGGGAVSLGSTITINASSSPTVGFVIATSTTQNSIFPYASSTAISTTYASSTRWFGGGLETDCDTAATSKLMWDITTGRFSCGTDQTGGGGSYPFTPTTNFATLVQATTGIPWFQNGLHSSSTVRILGSIDITSTSTGTMYVGQQAGGPSLPTNSTGVGIKALDSETVNAGANTAVGNFALAACTICVGQTAVGYNALLSQVDGAYNTAFGWDTLRVTLGSFNTGFGTDALLALINGDGNTSVGVQAGRALTSGSNNTFLGANSGYQDETGFYFANGTITSSSTISNSTAVGYAAQVGKSNSMVFGGTGANAVYAGFGTTTPWWLLQLATSTAPQLALTDTRNTNGWSLRAAGGNFYIASTSPLTYGTSTVAAITIDANSRVLFGNNNATCIALTGSAALCDGDDASGVGGGLTGYDAWLRLTNFATTTAATNTPIWTQGIFFSSSTKAASQFPYASTTALSVSGNSFLGTVSSGVWNGTTIAIANGGTNQTSFPTTGGMIYFDGTKLTQSAGGDPFFDAANSRFIVGRASGSFRINGVGANGNGYFGIDSASGVTAGDVFLINSSGNVGIATTTPGAKLGVTGDMFIAGRITSTSTLASIFPYASTTAISTSYASSTFWYGGGLSSNCDSGNVLTWNSGRFGCAADQTGVGGGTFAWTPTTNFGALTNSTNTPVWFKQGLQASSTANLADVSVWGKIRLVRQSNDVLATFNGNNFLTASTSAGNLSLGEDALNAITSGFANTVVGQSAFTVLSSGNYNTALGWTSAGVLTTGSDNISIGNQSSPGITGNYNIVIGDLAGSFLDSASNNILIGHYSDVPSATIRRFLNIGNLIYGTNIYDRTSPSSGASVDGKVGISTTTPFAQFSIEANGTTTPFIIGSSTQSFFAIDKTGRRYQGGSAAPTLSSCGTSPSLIQGNDNNGIVSPGSGSVTSCTITFTAASTLSNKLPVCTIQPATSTITRVWAASTTATTLVVAASVSFGRQTFSYQCERSFR